MKSFYLLGFLLLDSKSFYWASYIHLNVCINFIKHYNELVKNWYHHLPISLSISNLGVLSGSFETFNF